MILIYKPIISPRQLLSLLLCESSCVHSLIIELAQGNESSCEIDTNQTRKEHF